MTTRTDVTVEYQESPRIAEIASPSIEMTMQDLVDTLRKDEDAFAKGLAFDKLLDASGKEPLGGGVSVGITVALQDVKVAFEGRTAPAETGTVTTGSGSPIAGTITFEDTGATFITNGVARGSLVINFTDQSIADVVSVDSETQLTTKLLVNGIGNTFDVADVYHVFNVVQVELSGGNLTAVDAVDAELDPVLPTAFTQVVRTGSSSATIASSDPAANAAAVWNALSADFVAANTFGLAAGTTVPGEVNDLRGIFVTHEGTAQSGTATTIVLDTTSVQISDYYENQVITIVAGTGVGQQRVISIYTSFLGTGIATVDREWQTTPDATSQYRVGFSAATAHSIWDAEAVRHAVVNSMGEVLKTRGIQSDLATVLLLVTDLIQILGVDSGTAQAATASTITLRSGANSNDDYYNNVAITIINSFGVQQQRVIVDYDGTTKIATVDRPWQVLPSTSGYLLGFPSATANSIWGALTGDHEIAATFGKAVTRLFGQLDRTKLFFATAAITTGGRHVPAGGLSHMEVQNRDESGAFPGTSYFVVFNYDVGDAATDPSRSTNTSATAPTDGTFTSTAFPT